MTGNNDIYTSTIHHISSPLNGDVLSTINLAVFRTIDWVVDEIMLGTLVRVAGQVWHWG